MQSVSAKPLYIRMHTDDNVAIIANRGGLHPGADNLLKPNGEEIKQLPLEGYTFEGYRNADGRLPQHSRESPPTPLRCSIRAR